MSTAYLLLGSNQGDRQGILQQALVLLGDQAGPIVRHSKIYETAAWGNTEQPSFLNLAVQLQTAHTPETLLLATQGIENSMGRLRTEKWGQRTLDIDILFYDDLQMDTPFLRLPHPEISKRRFVLVPLCDIAPALQHPALQMSVQQLLEACTDPLGVAVFHES